MQTVEELAERWPALRTPAPPVPLPRENGSFSFNVESEWRELVAQGLRLRAPATSTAGLVGPFRARGGCLRGMFDGEELFFFDPAMPAQDGDVVLVEWHPLTLQKIVDRCRGKPEWVAMYGSEAGEHAVKWLRTMGHSYYLVSRESMTPLDADPHWGGANRILGVLRHVQRAGIAVAGSVAISACAINLDAASDTLVATNASQSLNPNNSQGMNADVTVPSMDYDADLVITATASCSLTRTTTGALVAVYAKIVDLGDSSGEEDNSGSPDASTGTTFTRTEYDVPASSTRYVGVVNQKTYTLAAGTSRTYRFYINGANINSGIGTNIRMTVRIHKR